MKVVQILPNLDGGGVEKGTLEIAKALVDNGHQSIVISAGGRMVEQLKAEGSEHITWDLGKKSPFTFRHIWAVRKWIKSSKADILHIRSRMPAWVIYLAWKGLNESERPHLVSTVHGLYSVSKYSEIMCRGERVIAVSNTVRNYIESNYPATDMSRVELIYRGVEADEFPYGYQPSDDWLAQWQHDYPQLTGKQVITLPGRLTRLKGHNDFIDLMKKLKQEERPVHGLIVGGIDPKRQRYAEELKQRIIDEGLSDTLTMTGNRSDIRDIFAVSTLVLSLSTKPESFGRTVLEALKMGVPVVGYDHGGVGEILQAIYPQGKTALNDAAQLFESVHSLLSKPASVNQTDSFLKQAMLDNTLKVYGDLLR